MKITLVPEAGLGNRLDAILNAIAINKKFGYEFIILWENNKEVAADWSDLFEPLTISKDINVYPLKKIIHVPGRKRNLYIPYFLRNFAFEKQFIGSKTTHKKFQYFAGSYNNIYISSWHTFSADEVDYDNIGKYFRPISVIQQRIKGIIDSYSDNTIGLHIRRTDNVKSIVHSTDQKFIEVIEKELATNENTKFYVASDNYAIKDKLKNLFGEDKIIAPKLELSRKTLLGMQDAVMDMYCLGKTKKIYGSYWSSYSEMASRLFNAELIIK